MRELVRRLRLLEAEHGQVPERDALAELVQSWQVPAFAFTDQGIREWSEWVLKLDGKLPPVSGVNG